MAMNCLVGKRIKMLNYYTNEEIRIPLDPQLTARENSQKFFDKYNKLKRTYEAVNRTTEETHREIEHLESINTALDIALKEDDLVQIKEEMMEYGYIPPPRRQEAKSQRSPAARSIMSPSDGFHIYVGKNNYQNEELTFKFCHRQRLDGSMPKAFQALT